MFHVRWLALSLVMNIMALAPLSSQSHALFVYGHAGRLFPLMNLSEAGDDLSPGKAYGGGLGIQLGATTALRATVSISESKQRGPTLDLSDPATKRQYYGIEMMFGAPSDVGFAPYLFFGGGRMVIDPAQPDTERTGKWTGRLGTGVNYVPDNSIFVLFAEVSGWAYQFELLGFDKLQLDAAVLGGLAFALPY